MASTRLVADFVSVAENRIVAVLVGQALAFVVRFVAKRFIRARRRPGFTNTAIAAPFLSVAETAIVALFVVEAAL